METAQKVLGRACFISGFNVQDFTQYSYKGAGKYVSSYVKIDKQPVLARGVPEKPDFILVFDSAMAVKEILKNAAGSVAIFNSAGKPKLGMLKKNKIKAYYLDASEIGKSLAGKYAPAAAMLGALAKKFNKLSVKNIKASVQHELSDAESYIACVEEGYRRVS